MRRRKWSNGRAAAPVSRLLGVLWGCSNVESRMNLCHEAIQVCVCTLAEQHEGAHVCRCGGSWEWRGNPDDLQSFKLIRLPGSNPDYEETFDDAVETQGRLVEAMRRGTLR